MLSLSLCLARRANIWGILRSSGVCLPLSLHASLKEFMRKLTVRDTHFVLSRRCRMPFNKVCVDRLYQKTGIPNEKKTCRNGKWL